MSADGAARPDVFGFEGVRRLLAHRFPILMVDRIVAFEPGRSIDVIKLVSGNDIVFLGHFPDHAVWPGLFTGESMAQASALLFVLSRYGEGYVRDGQTYVLNKVNVTFLRPVHPGDTLAVRSEAIKLIDHALVARVTARVDGALVARGEMVLGEIVPGAASIVAQDAPAEESVGA